MNDLKGSRALLLLLGCLAAQTVAAVSVIPPWQNPDEPQHVMAARLILAYGPNFAFDKQRDEAGEQGIVTSMAHHQWWRHYGVPTPEPLPSTFADGPGQVVRDAFVAPSGSRLYYRVAATLFQLGHIDSVVGQLYAMRMLSMAAALLMMIVVWAANRLWLDAPFALALGLLLALLPQFTIVSTTASPDAAANLAGAIVWWSALRLLLRPVSLGPLAILWAAAILGFLIRRMAAPLLLGALVITLFVFVRHLRSGPVAAGMRRFLYVLAVVLAAAGTAWWVTPDDLDVRTMSWRSSTLVDVLSGVQAVRFDPGLAASTIVERLDALPNFGEALFRSFWLSAGWIRYSAPGAWYFVLALLSFAAVIGLFLPRRRGTEERLVSGVAAALLLVQLAAVVIYYFGIMKAGPQGRYLFPVLPAALSLAWIGWLRLFPLQYRTAAAVTLLAVIAVFNVATWTLVLIPAYS